MNENDHKNHPKVLSLKIAGVGPGDPSLLTLAAVKAIQDATLVAYPVSVKGGMSLAAQIASDWISEDKKLLEIYFPMVKDPIVLKKAWRHAVEQLIDVMRKGEQVVLLCQGDASLFSTASYVLLELKKNYPDCCVHVIPGITSFSAAAAISRLPLILQQEQLLVLSTPDEPNTMQKLLIEANESDRVIAFLKIGNKWEWMRPLLKKMNLLETSLFAEKVGFPDQQVKFASQVPEEVKPYFSLLLVRQHWPEILDL